ncbi:SAF domain-containing protein [Phycicoccus avicenniae]|uniref:SAF domain-containing protein n=1 Tax=Phycicoccus avicenniae TaxID=2828860 RepID=UPI003D2A138F
MTDLPTPTASRLRAPSWRDSRLLVGVLLVLVSTVLGGFVLARADRRVPVYAASGTLAPGERLTADDVTVVRVQLGDETARYLAADGPLPADVYALRELRPGELVPRSGVGSAADVGVQQVALQVDATSAASLVRGSVVDVYVNRPADGGSVGVVRYQGPERVLEAISVVAVAEEDSVLAGAEQTRAVRVMVPRDAVRDLVADVDVGARITLVPVPGGTP